MRSPSRSAKIKSKTHFGGTPKVIGRVSANEDSFETNAETTQVAPAILRFKRFLILQITVHLFAAEFS